MSEIAELSGKTFDEHFAEISARLAAIRLNVMRFDATNGFSSLKLPVAEPFDVRAMSRDIEPASARDPNPVDTRGQNLAKVASDKSSAASPAPDPRWGRANTRSPALALGLCMLAALTMAILAGHVPAPNEVRADAPLASWPRLATKPADAEFQLDVAPGNAQAADTDRSLAAAAQAMPSWWGSLGPRSFSQRAPMPRDAWTNEADAVTQALVSYAKAAGASDERLYRIVELRPGGSRDNAAGANPARPAAGEKLFILGEWPAQPEVWTSALDRIADGSIGVAAGGAAPLSERR